MTAPIQPAPIADLVIYNGKIATQDDKRSFVTSPASDANTFWGALGCSCFEFHAQTQSAPPVASS